MQEEELDKIYEIEQEHWWYLSRKRITQVLFRDEFHNENNLKILDIASACGRNFEYFEAWGQVFGIDISPQSIEFCKRRGIHRIIQADATELPFKKDYFDAILAFDALEHFSDDRLALRGFYRVLKTRGRLFISAPALMMLWSPHDIAFHHFRRYSMHELEEKLENCGFVISRITYWSCILMPFIYLERKFRQLLWKKEASSPKSDFFLYVPFFIEWILGKIQHFEFGIIKRGMNLRFGVSLICSAYKK